MTHALAWPWLVNGFRSNGEPSLRPSSSRQQAAEHCLTVTDLADQSRKTFAMPFPFTIFRTPVSYSHIQSYSCLFMISVSFVSLEYEAQAAVNVDKENIFRMVEQSCGFSQLNSDLVGIRLLSVTGAALARAFLWKHVETFVCAEH